MTILLWDASAWVKRYFEEQGSDVVEALASATDPRHSVLTVLGYAETQSILLRRRNARDLDANTYRVAVSSLESDVLWGGAASMLDIGSDDIVAGIELLRRHNLNSADAAILQVYLRFVAAMHEPTLFVASDKRLLRAARLEGLRTLNPEELSPDDLQGITGHA